MISIPITEEAHETLKATMPGIDQPRRSKARTDRCRSGSIVRSSTGFGRFASRVKALAT